jgi:hypothetical protein
MCLCFGNTFELCLEYLLRCRKCYAYSSLAEVEDCLSRQSSYVPMFWYTFLLCLLQVISSCCYVT